mgnify:CR=1 FL=1
MSVVLDKLCTHIWIFFLNGALYLLYSKKTDKFERQKDKSHTNNKAKDATEQLWNGLRFLQLAGIKLNVFYLCLLYVRAKQTIICPIKS